MGRTSIQSGELLITKGHSGIGKRLIP